MKRFSVVCCFLVFIFCGNILAHSFLANGPLYQLLTVTSPDWNSHRGWLRRFERSSEKGPWQPVGELVPVLLGKKGMAWGIGLQEPQPGEQKREGDWKTPAGRFRIGFAMGTPEQLIVGNHGWPYRHITEDIAWIDDPGRPDYNHWVEVGETPKPAWFARQRMKPEDPTYHWLLLIEHNYPKAVPGAGSAIFFHARRGEDVPSSGCTVMEREALEEILRWLKPEANPQVVQLPRQEYERWQRPGDLPPLADVFP